MLKAIKRLAAALGLAVLLAGGIAEPAHALPPVQCGANWHAHFRCNP